MLKTSELLLHNCEINKHHLSVSEKSRLKSWENVSFKTKAAVFKYHIVLMFSDSALKFILTMAEIGDQSDWQVPCI